MQDEPEKQQDESDVETDVATQGENAPGDAAPAPEPEAPAVTSEDGQAPETEPETVAEDPGSSESPTPEAEAPERSNKAAKPEKKQSPVKPPPPERLAGAVEAMLLVAGDVVRLERLRDLLGLPSLAPLREVIDQIKERWVTSGLAMELEEVAGGVRVVTRPEYAEYVGRLSRRPASDKLSRTQLEALCIVAYKQPVGRAEIERIRGVQSGEPLRALLERRLLKVVGRSDQPGRPLLYGTSQQFLTAFGLNDLKDLPSAKDFKRL